MKEIAIGFQNDDLELKELLFENYGKDIKIFESKEILGPEIIFVAVIPIIALTIQTIDFFKTHFTDKNKGRVIITKDGNISLEGYTINEIKKILKKLINE